MAPCFSETVWGASYSDSLNQTTRQSQHVQFFLPSALLKDAKWHDWHEFLESTVLYVHWQRLVLHSSSHGGVPLPMEWYLPEVLEMVLVGDDDVEVSTQGIKIAARSVQTPEEKSVHSTTLVEDVEDGKVSF